MMKSNLRISLASDLLTLPIILLLCRLLFGFCLTHLASVLLGGARRWEGMPANKQKCLVSLVVSLLSPGCKTNGLFARPCADGWCRSEHGPSGWAVRRGSPGGADMRLMSPPCTERKPRAVASWLNYAENVSSVLSGQPDVAEWMFQNFDTLQFDKQEVGVQIIKKNNNKQTRK